MNIINIDINFTEGTLEPNGIDLITGDYNSTEIDFSFDEAHQENRKVFEMKSPSNEVVMLEEIRDNKIGLYGLVDVTTTHDDKTYIKYTKNDTVYWYNKEDNKLYDDEWNEIVTFDLTEYTKVQKKSSLFQEEGYYIFEISCYGADSKLTSVSGRLPVVKEQVPISDEIVEPYLPIFDQLIQDVDSKIEEVDTKIEEVDTKLETIDGKLEDIDTAITQTNNLNIDVSDKVNKDVTITLTKKDNTTKSVVISDGTSLQFMWQGTSLGIKTDDMQDYVFVDLQGIQGVPGPQGEPFRIKKTYPSVEAMNADFNNMNYGDYVMIASSVEVQDNAKLYTKGETQWIFITDFSGATGIKGETGATPNIQIGTVTSGSTPSVTRTGTDENPILNFVLQKGDTGQTGQTGATGETGNGISNIEKTSETPTEKDYRINFTDGTHFDYSVENGEVTQEQLDEVIEENTYLNNVINQLPKVNGTGSSITLDNTIEAKMKCKLSPSEMTQEGTPTPSSPQDIHTTTGDNTIYDMGKNKLNGANPTDYGYATSTFNNDIIKVSSTATNTLPQARWEFNVSANDTIRYSGIIQNSNGQIVMQYDNNGTWTTIQSMTSIYSDGVTPATKSYTNDVNTTKVRVLLYSSRTIPTGNSESNYKNVIVTINNSDITYEPYLGNTYPLYLGYENLFDGEIELGNISADDGTLSNSTTRTRSVNFIKVKPNTTYTYTHTTGNIRWIVGYTSEKIGITDGMNDHPSSITSKANSVLSFQFTTTPTTEYIKWYDNSCIDTTEQVMLEEGSVAHRYTKYGEAVEYSKIGNYEDEFIIPSGKNLLNLNNFEPATNNSTITLLQTGIKIINASNGYGAKIVMSNLKENTDYYLSYNYEKISETAINRVAVFVGTTTSTTIKDQYNASGFTFNTGNNTTINIWFYARNGGVAEVNYTNIILNEGTTALPYEPYNNGKWYLKNYKDEGQITTDEFISFNDSYTNLNVVSIPKNTDDIKKGNVNRDIPIFCNKATYSTRPSGIYDDATLIGKIYDSANVAYFIGLPKTITTFEEAKTYLGNITYWFVRKTPKYILLNDTLQEQLTNIYNNMVSKKGQTNISQVNNDLPMIISASALLDLNSLIGG